MDALLLLVGALLAMGLVIVAIFALIHAVAEQIHDRRHAERMAWWYQWRRDHPDRRDDDFFP